MLSVGGILNSRRPGVVKLLGTIDASLATNLPTNPLAGDTYRVVVAGYFEGSPLIIPAGSTFNVGDRIQWQLDGSGWLKIDSTENIIDDPYSIAWSGDQENAPSRNTTYDKFQAVIGDYTALIAAEETARIAADGVLQSNIDAEEAARIAGDALLQSNLDTEEAARIAGDLAIQANVDAVVADLAQEVLDRIAADGVLQAGLDAEEARALAAEALLQSNIDAEEAARIAADGVLQSNIDAEEARALNAESVLQANIDAEEARAIAAEALLQTDIDTEEARALAAEGVLQANIDSEALDRLSGDNALDARVSQIENQGSFSGKELVLKDQPGILYELNSLNRTGSTAPSPVTYPAKTVTGATSFETNLMDATEDIQAFSSQQVLTFSGCSQATFMGIKRIAGVALANQAKVVRVEVSDDGKAYEDQDSASYFDNVYLSKASTWANGTFLYYPVNKLKKAHVRVTLSGADASSFSVSKLQFAGFAGLALVEQWDIAGLTGIEDIDPYTFKSTTGDRWVYVVSSAGNLGSVSELVHETYLKEQATFLNLTSFSLFVAGGYAVVEIGSYANTMTLRPGEIIARPNESVDLKGAFTLNGIPLDYQTLDLAGENTLGWDKSIGASHFVTTGESVADTLFNGWDIRFSPGLTQTGTATGGVMSSGGSHEISISTTSLVTIKAKSRFFFIASEQLDSVAWGGGDLAGVNFDYLGAYSGEHVYRFKGDDELSETAQSLQASRVAGAFTARITMAGYHPFDLVGIEVKDGGITLGKLSSALQAKMGGLGPNTVVASTPGQTVFNFGSDVGTSPVVALDGIILTESEYAVTGTNQITLSAGVPVSTNVTFFVAGGNGEVNPAWSSESQAKGGSNNDSMMTPLRTKQAIDKFANANLEQTAEGGSLLAMAPFSSAPVSPHDGDVWIRFEGGVTYLEARIAGVTKQVVLS